MPATTLAKNNILNYNFGQTAYPDTLPATMWFGLSLTAITASANSVVIPTAFSFATLTTVTLTVANSFSVGDIVTVEGVNSAFTVTNVDGTWELIAGTDATKIVFTVTSTVTGSTPQTLTGGTVTKLLVSEPTAGGYARVDYTNNKTTWSVSTAGTLSNAIDIVFPGATADEGIALSIFIADAETGGHMWWYDTLSPSITILDTMIITFSAGTIVVSM